MPPRPWHLTGLLLLILVVWQTLWLRQQVLAFANLETSAPTPARLAPEQPERPPNLDTKPPPAVPVRPRDFVNPHWGGGRHPLFFQPVKKIGRRADELSARIPPEQQRRLAAAAVAEQSEEMKLLRLLEKRNELIIRHGSLWRESALEPAQREHLIGWLVDRELLADDVAGALGASPTPRPASAAAHGESIKTIIAAEDVRWWQELTARVGPDQVERVRRHVPNAPAQATMEAIRQQLAAAEAVLTDFQLQTLSVIWLESRQPGARRLIPLPPESRGASFFADGIGYAQLRAGQTVVTPLGELIAGPLGQAFFDQTSVVLSPAQQQALEPLHAQEQAGLDLATGYSRMSR